MLQISVIVPCYNQAEYLNDCLTSVLNQTFHDWECIIVNDGSSDTTELVAMEWLKKDHRFKYFKKENGGLSHTRNFGIERAKGEYILPLDADDRISSNFLELCYDRISNNKKIKLVYGAACFFGEVNKVWELCDYNLERLKNYNMIYCSALYRKKDWKKVGGYDVKMIYGYEDWEFWIHLLKNGGEVIMDKKCFFYYRVKKTSMIKDLDEDETKINKMKEYIHHKHHRFYNPSNLIKVLEFFRKRFSY